jgi:hypothetical protein
MSTPMRRPVALTRLPGSADLEMAWRELERLQPMVDAHVTPERLLRYVKAIADMPAPSTAASAMRTPVLRDLLADDGALEGGSLTLDDNFGNTGSTVMLTGRRDHKPLWYFAHLDTISYLVQPARDGRYPLVPFCYHLMADGACQARAYSYDLDQGGFRLAAEGHLESEGGIPFFRAADATTKLSAGDRVVPVTALRTSPDGECVGHLDNAGGVAALAVAAPVLAGAQIEAMLGFPDEEEGPRGSGNQMMGRGSARVIAPLGAPDLAVVIDMQQAGGEPIEAPLGAENTTRIGQGAVLSEFSSLARGAVTPPPLYAVARAFSRRLADKGVAIQESNNVYTSRSDDVSVLLKTPNILLLGFPGFDRHFDRAEPRGHLFDLVHLSKALVYVSALGSLVTSLRNRRGSND